MAGLLNHFIIYVVVCGLAIVGWVVAGEGTWAELGEIARDPSLARVYGFWMIWPILLWGGALLIHAGAVISFGLFGRKARRRRRERARKVHESMKRAKRERRNRPPRHPGPKWAQWLPDGVQVIVTEKGAKDDNQQPAAGGSTPVGRHWVVVMFTDIARSTPLAESLGDDAWAEMLLEHRKVVRTCIGKHEGTEVGTQGDGFLVRFEVPDQAVWCAIELQQCLDDARSSGGFTPSVRVGIHAGEAMYNEEDVVGRVVNLASRVVDAAEPNEILLTEPVADHLERPVALGDRGLKELKGISQARHLLAVNWRNPEVIVLEDA